MILQQPADAAIMAPPERDSATNQGFSCDEN